MSTAKLPIFCGPFADSVERDTWHAAFAAAYAQPVLRASSWPSFTLHSDSRDTAKLVADATIVALRETESEATREAKLRSCVRRQAGRAMNRALAISAGEEPKEAPLPGPDMAPLKEDA